MFLALQGAGVVSFLTKEFIMAKKGSGGFIMAFSLLVASACLTFVHRTFFDERERIVPMGEGSFVTVRFSPRGEGLALALESIKVAKEQICLHALLQSRLLVLLSLRMKEG